MISPKDEHLQHCRGWHCLSPTEKFGIIFSIVIVSIILAIAWMCYLGKRARTWKTSFSYPLPGGRRVERNPHLPPGVSLGQLPLAQRHPGQPAQVVYQPVIYRLGDQQTFHAYPYLTAGHFQPYASRARSSQAMPLTNQGRPAFALSEYPTIEIGQDPVHPVVGDISYPPEHVNQPSKPRWKEGDNHRSPTWRQRLNQILSLPVGRASTITSNSSPRHSISVSRMPSTSRTEQIRGRREARESVRSACDRLSLTRSVQGTFKARTESAESEMGIESCQPC